MFLRLAMWSACSSLAANGLIVMAPSCVNSPYPSAEESWEETTKKRPEKETVVLTRFRPVTWSSGHLGRRKFTTDSQFATRTVFSISRFLGNTG